MGLRPAHYARNRLLLPQAISSHADDSGNIARLVYDQLKRLGNNLNQMMRHLHQTGEPVPADLGPLLTDIRDLIAKVNR